MLSGCHIAETTKEEHLAVISRLEQKITELERQIENYERQLLETSYINMNTSIFMRELVNENLDELNKLASAGLHFEKRENEIFAVKNGNEVKLTDHTENENVYSYFYEPATFSEDGDEARVTVRLNYHDEQEQSVQEDRHFVLILQKSGDDWLIQEIYN